MNDTAPFAENCTSPISTAEYNVGLHVGGIFIVFGASSFGILGAIALSAFKHKILILIVQLLKFFGVGVVAATAWIHILPDAFEIFANPCLLAEGGWAGYGSGKAWVGLFALLAAFFVQGIEFAAITRRDVVAKRHRQAHLDHEKKIIEGRTIPAPHEHCEHCESSESESSSDRKRSRRDSHDDEHDSHDHHDENGHDLQESEASTHLPVHSSEHGHDHGHGHSHDHKHDDKSPDLHDIAGHSHEMSHVLTEDGSEVKDVATIMLEAGVLIHSAVIGLALGVATDEWKSLLIAISFHQLFEGIALGTRIAELKKSTMCKKLGLGILYPLTTPIGTSIGIGIHASYNESSYHTLVTQGILQSLSAGILIYNAYVELIAIDMNHNKAFRAQSPMRKLASFLAMFAGAGVMALLAIWA